MTEISQLYEESLTQKQKRKQGIYYTNSDLLLKIIQPCLIDDWQERIQKIDSQESFKRLYEEFKAYRVLDPACGSGNFLVLAYEKLKEIENQFFRLSMKLFHFDYQKAQERLGHYSLKNLSGIDLDESAVLLTKVSLCLLQKKLKEKYDLQEEDLSLPDLPQIRQGDALALKWDEVDLVVSNPPFLGGGRIRTERGNEYFQWLSSQFPQHNRMADYCTYWYEKVLQDCKPGIRVGFVSTNSVTQNHSRRMSLERIIEKGGTIFQADSSIPWSGTAAVHVSLVNYINQKPYEKVKKLNGQEVNWIDERLKGHVSQQMIQKPLKLKENLNLSFIGVQPNSTGFLLTFEEAEKLIEKNPKNQEVIKNFLIGKDVTQGWSWKGSRMIINFQDWPLEKAMTYPDCFQIVREKVKPQRDQMRVGTNDTQKAKTFWWFFLRPSIKMREHLKPLDRFIVTPVISKYRVLTMIQNQNLIPDNTACCIASNSYSVLGILTSKFHVKWSLYQGSTLGISPRYTPTTCFETFPFPQEKENQKVAEIMESIEHYRKSICQRNQQGLTTLYNEMFKGNHLPLKELHQKLDKEVADLYGFPHEDLKNETKIISFLMKLNHLA